MSATRVDCPLCCRMLQRAHTATGMISGIGYKVLQNEYPAVDDFCKAHRVSYKRRGGGPLCKTNKTLYHNDPRSSAVLASTD